MTVRFFIASVCLLWPSWAGAEMMVTSYYRAKNFAYAAHRTLPIGTHLLLTNPRNGRTVRVTIKGRGPFIRGRSMDISHAAAKQLGFGRSGVARLHTQIVGR
jgi:rare lipoprotein A